MTLIEELRDLLTRTRNSAAALEHRSVRLNLTRLGALVDREGLEIDPDGLALEAIEEAFELLDMIDDGSSPEWDEIPDAIDTIEDEIDWD